MSSLKAENSDRGIESTAWASQTKATSLDDLSYSRTTPNGELKQQGVDMNNPNRIDWTEWLLLLFAIAVVALMLSANWNG